MRREEAAEQERRASLRQRASGAGVLAGLVAEMVSETEAVNEES